MRQLKDELWLVIVEHCQGEYDGLFATVIYCLLEYANLWITTQLIAYGNDILIGLIIKVNCVQLFVLELKVMHQAYKIFFDVLLHSRVSWMMQWHLY